MHCEMTVFGFAMDSLTNRPVVILKDATDSHTIPIWLSAGEALSIAAELILTDSTTRSGGKGLLALLMETTETEIGSIAIEAGNDGGYTGSVTFVCNGEETRVAVRPCEAIVAALRFKRPITMAEAVLQRSSVLEVSDDEITRENNARRFAEFLENLDPATLGKYPM